MKQEPFIPNDLEELRSNAEKWLINNKPKAGFQLDEYASLKLIHELEVHQIELEMQHDELKKTKVLAKEVVSGMYEEIFDLEPFANFILSNEGRILKSNLAGCALLGVDPSQIVSLKFSLFLAHSSKRMFNFFMYSIFAHHTRNTCEVTINAKRSAPLKISLTGIISKDKKHCLITAIKHNQPLLTDESLNNVNRYKRYFEDGLTGDFIADGKGFILDCNHTFLEIFGLKNKKAIIGKNFSSFHPEPSEFNSLISKLNEFKILKDYKAIRTRNNGEVVHIVENIMASFNSNNEIFEIKGSIYDVSELIKTEDELKQKNKQLEILNSAKNKFFSIIAHDLRAPFSGFLGLTEIMATEMPSLEKEEIQHMSELLWHSSANLFNLLENLLLWSQMEQGTFPYKPEIIPLNSFVEETLETEMQIAANKHIEVVIEIADQITVFADTYMLRSVISNLVSNAVKFTSKGGTINISAMQMNQSNIEIVIIDTGVGMTPDLLKKLFKINNQVGRKGTDGELSAGLGLLLCKEFIDKHSGMIWANSIEGKGSDFHVMLPGSKI